ncbi:hypothetical protein [Rufibacter sp. LB8]|uniref:hypothetical protein n=1 Tax=Rufibacter sp. LB8 TaxID=2777781 RepID=UPI00178C6688|nr:hypothetical protein [Rufibacter sp. LB8]
MNGTKKCPTCGQWSSWNQNPEDRCQHCQAPLDPAAVARKQDREDHAEQQKKQFTVDFIQLDPADPWHKQLYKRIGLGFQVAFVGIVSFILWLIALLAG